MSLFTVAAACHIVRNASRHSCDGGSEYRPSPDDKPLFPPKGQTVARLRFVAGMFLMLVAFVAPFAIGAAATMVSGVHPMWGVLLSVVLGIVSLAVGIASPVLMFVIAATLCDY